MKKLILILSGITVLLTATGFVLSSNGIPGATGSPSENTCASCHTGGAGLTTVSISATPALTGNQYIPGQTYTISIDVSNANFSKFGFGAEILNSSNTNAGLMQNGGAGVIFANSGGRKNAIHSAPKTGSGAASFTFEWTTPASGDATIYAAGNAVNGNNNTNGDRGGNISLALTSISTGIKEAAFTPGIKVFPNPTMDEVSIHYHLLKESDIKIALYDLSGKEVTMLTGEKQNPGLQTLTYKFDNSLSKGIYILKFYADEKIAGEKLVVRN